MPVEADGRPAPGSDGTSIRVAAAGDLHCHEANRREVTEAFAKVDGTVDLILLAGDLTTHGEPDQGRVLADACRELETPVVAVLGNHDWHVNRRDELVGVIEDAGVRVLDRDWLVCHPRGVEVGVVGAKGYVGGFPGSHIPDFGEPSTRALYREAGEEVAAIEEGLRATSTCPLRIVLMHYAPVADTLRGEPESIWAFLGSDRLAAPLLEHQPDLVLHGHAHAGAFEGQVGEVP